MVETDRHRGHGAACPVVASWTSTSAGSMAMAVMRTPASAGKEGLEKRGVHDDLAASCRPRNGKGNRRELYTRHPPTSQESLASMPITIPLLPQGGAVLFQDGIDECGERTDQHHCAFHFRRMRTLLCNCRLGRHAW